MKFMTVILIITFILQRKFNYENGSSVIKYQNNGINIFFTGYRFKMIAWCFQRCHPPKLKLLLFGFFRAIS